MAPDVAETTPRARRGSRVDLATAGGARADLTLSHDLARRAAGDDGTNDLLVSDVIRTNELQVWFLAEHLVDVPLVHAK